MTNKTSKWEFIWLGVFLLTLATLLTNGFAERIFAQNKVVDVYAEISPIGDVLAEIMRSYVEEPETDKVVEGALRGMLRSLDDHSSYMAPRALQDLTEDTQGEFDGIGVQIILDKYNNLMILQPLAGSPAIKEGIIPGDYITEVDGTSTKGMSTTEAADKIKGPRGETVNLTIVRFPKREVGKGKAKKLSIDIKRGKISDESISEARILADNIGYIRIGDFKKNTAKELQHEIKALSKQGMKALILDLRWNPGGLLTAPKNVCELFLEKGSLVTYTKGRPSGNTTDDLKLYTEKKPFLPQDFPIVLMVNGTSASSSEIVTGALQYHARAIVLGQKTYGKGTVQTIITLQRPKGAALRITTARYYTPADVTIDKMGIRPDIEVEMTPRDSANLWRQLYLSFVGEAYMRDKQDHGDITGNEVTDETVEDIQLKRALEVLGEEMDFAQLLAKYHKDPSETQVASPENGGPKKDVGPDILDDDGIPIRLYQHDDEEEGDE